MAILIQNNPVISVCGKGITSLSYTKRSHVTDEFVSTSISFPLSKCFIF